MSDLVETTTREVRVFSTLIRRKLDSQATTWGELQTELKREKIRFDNMRVAIGKSKLTLEHPGAELPTTPFTLYLMPTKTKSGTEWDEESIRTLSYTEMRDLVRDLFLEDDFSAHEHFNDGDHYTNKKKDSLEKSLIEWFNIKKRIKTLTEDLVLNGSASQEFQYSHDDFLKNIVKGLESFRTNKDHLSNAVRECINILNQSLENWSEQENEYEQIMSGFHQEDEYEDYEEDDELGI